MKITLNMQLESRGQIISEPQLCLLQKISELGSIKAAAECEKISYKTAWDRVKSASCAAGEELVDTSSKKGGAKITAAGEKILAKYQQFLDFKQQLGQDLQPKISARNRLRARVCEIASGQNCAKITAKFKGIFLRAKISCEALNELKIKANQEVNFVFKTFALRLFEGTSDGAGDGERINQIAAIVLSCQQLKSGEFLCKISLGKCAHSGREITLGAISPRALEPEKRAVFSIREDDIILML